MKLAHLSDFHLTEKQLDEQSEILESTLAQLVEARPAVIALTGDFYGHTVPHRSTPRERGVLVRWVARLASLAPTVIVKGNHDYPGDLNILEHLGGELGNLIKVVEGAERVGVWTADGAVTLYCMAYPTKAWLLAGETMGAERARIAVGERLGDLLDTWRIHNAGSSTPSVVLGHCLTRQSRVQGGEVLSGAEIEVSVEQLEAIGAAYTGIGHIHMRQQLGPRTWHVGSLWRNSFAEVEKKGWHLVDLKTGAVEFVESRCAPWLTVRATWTQTGDRWEWVEDRPDAIPNGAHVRVVFEVPQSQRQSAPMRRYLASVEDRRPNRIKVDTRITQSQRARVPEIQTSESTADRLALYWESLERAPSDEDRRDALAALDELRRTPQDLIENEVRGLTYLPAGQTRRPTGERDGHPANQDRRDHRYRQP